MARVNGREQASVKLSSATASQFSPTAAARSRYSFTVERAIRTLRDTAVSLSPSPSFNRQNCRGRCIGRPIRGVRMSEGSARP